MTPPPDESAQLLAAGDRDRLAFRILSDNAEAPDEIVLFHAQQAAEKFIQVVLAARGVIYRRTHDLFELSSLAAQQGLQPPVEQELLVRMGPYAVQFRYLGVSAPEVSRGEAEAMLENLRAWARSVIEG